MSRRNVNPGPPKHQPWGRRNVNPWALSLIFNFLFYLFYFITSHQNAPARRTKKITFRPLPQSGINLLGQWLQKQTWEEVYNVVTAHDKAAILQDMLLNQMNKYLPEKTITVTSDDQPWNTREIKQLDRKQKREFNRNRKSPKWKQLNELFKMKTRKGKLL